MGFRFRRSIRILPGLRLNLGKRSASVSLGVRGAHVTLRPGHKARTTVGLPGSGISYTSGGQLDQREPVRLDDASEPETPRGTRHGVALFVAALIFLALIALVLGSPP